MSQNIDDLLSNLAAHIEYIRALITNNNSFAAYGIQNQSIGVSDGESFASGMQHGDMLVPSSDIPHPCMYYTVSCVLSDVVLVSHDVLTNYSANPSSEVQPAYASGILQSPPHPPPAPVVNSTCKIGLGCSLPLESTARSIRSHLREHGYVHKDRERASCPWQGCGKEMRWTNVARHIKEAHLGDRRPCKKCGKLYTRKEALDAHTKKCR